MLVAAAQQERCDCLRSGVPSSAAARRDLRQLIEANSEPVVSFPDDPACQLQTIILHDQVEALCERQSIDRVGKLDGRADSGNVAHRAWIFVAAVFGDGSLIYPVARGDPGFNHGEK